MATRLGAACLALAIVSTPAWSQALVCGERNHVVKRLEQSYGEAQQSYGLLDEGAMIEVWVAKDTGTFTILRTMTDGRSCIVAAGEAWRLKDLAAFLPGEAA